MNNEGYIDDIGRSAIENAEKQSTTEPSCRASISSSRNLKSILAQCFATFVNSLTYVSLGIMYTIPTVVIGKVQNASFGLSLNEEQASWYASFLPMSQPFGCLLGGFLQNYIGRKQGLLLMNVSTIVAWILLYKATTVEMLYVSSILMGVSIGFAEAPSITYVCEIATPKLRGSLVTYHTANVILGLVLTFLLTSFVNWRTACLFCMGLSIFSILMLFFIPDSPIWLINKGRMADAKRALQWLRGWVPEAYVIPEFEELSRHIRGAYNFESAVNEKTDGPVQEEGFKMGYLLEAGTLRPFVLLVWFASFGVAASALGAKNYYIIIFDSLSLPVDSNFLCLMNGVASLVGSLVCSVTVKTLGKRVLSLASMISTSILTMSLGFYILFKNELLLPSVFVALFILQGFTQTIGIYCTIPWVLLGEVYPVKTRSAATGMTGAAFYISLFVFFKTYYYLQLWLTTQGTFVFYGVIGIVGFVYLWIYMPETEGKTMAEIGELFEDDARKSCPHFRKKK